MIDKIKLLFLCTGNSCRSQMAEGLTKTYKGDTIEAYSAGTQPADRVAPYAVQAMNEIGIDISEYYPKNTDRLKNITFDYVITLCSHANETCPFFPAKVKVIHKGFDDPTCLAEYRKTRDEIKSYILTLPASLGEKNEKVSLS
jgi:arsenate reductase